jgi:hypothetical protein
MKKILLITCAAFAAGAGLPLIAGADEIGDLKKEMQALQKKVEKLESAPAAATVLPAGTSSKVLDRYSLNDQQEAAARLDNLTIDPENRGFMRIPNSDVIMKLNAKPHVDVTADSGNAGDKYRFVPAKIPVEGDPAEGGGEQFNINANGSQIRWDVRAPKLPGAPRFYYQNDFFGQSGADMKYRLQHLYGSVGNVVAGYTYGVFEDPDIWPDTVDYEGPNSAIFARRPLVHYKQSISDGWTATYGIEKPDFYVDDAGIETAGTDTPMPDIGANLRWEGDAGHLQLSAIVRDIGIKTVSNGNDSVTGFGGNLGGTYKVTDSLMLLAMVNVGEGTGGMGNDSGFANSDAAFDANGELQALGYVSGLVGLTQNWNEKWRSTVSYGYVDLDNTDAQSGDAYKETTYVSANLVCQVRKQMSIGLETLYGEKVTKDDSSGDVWRVQLGLVYSIF